MESRRNLTHHISFLLLYFGVQFAFYSDSWMGTIVQRKMCIRECYKYLRYIRHFHAQHSHWKRRIHTATQYKLHARICKHSRSHVHLLVYANSLLLYVTPLFHQRIGKKFAWFWSIFALFPEFFLLLQMHSFSRMKKSNQFSIFRN